MNLISVIIRYFFYLTISPSPSNLYNSLRVSRIVGLHSSLSLIYGCCFTFVINDDNGINPRRKLLINSAIDYYKRVKNKIFRLCKYII